MAVVQCLRIYEMVLKKCLEIVEQKNYPKPSEYFRIVSKTMLFARKRGSEKRGPLEFRWKYLNCSIFFRMRAANIEEKKETDIYSISDFGTESFSSVIP